MVSAQDVPSWSDPTIRGLLWWWREMAERRLIFHPDDAPESIVSVESGEAVFDASACQKLKDIIARMMILHGDDVYSAGFEAMKEFLLGFRSKAG
ncbi:MAG: hypothetical protein MI745_01425 [Pseudomonadales bacterium]|nr:hypothetical protein [Pseudomonadales bacterium]